MSKELSGAAVDVLHALFFRGALVDGDLPSKAGAAELRELGYMKTQDTVTPFGGEHYFNFLTPAGQEFAISYLVDSKFGKRSPRSVSELVFKADRFKIQANVDAIVEAMNAAYARQEAMMFELASAQAAIAESINQAVNDAIANALKPGGVLYTSRTRT